MAGKTKVIDLKPGEWTSPSRPNEPFFGEGVWHFIGYISGAAIILTALHCFGLR